MMSKTPRRGIENFAKNFFLFFFSFFLFLFLAEGAVRVFRVNYAEFIRHPVDRGEPQFHDPDDELGWVLRPGRFVWKEPMPGIGDLTFTIGEGRLRVTGGQKNNDLPSIALIGGSIMFGFGLSDEQTFPWKLQERLDNFQVLNLGVPGYGTYQSYLSLRRRIEKNGKKVKVVLYGLIEDHERRNVADFFWLKSLYRVNPVLTQKPLAVPFVSLSSNGTIIQREPESYSLSPFTEVSKLWRMVEDSAQKITKYRMHYAERATLSLIEAVSEYCHSRGIKFIVMSMDKKYNAFLSSKNIAYVDMWVSKVDAGNWKLKYDRTGHLGEKAQDYWVEKLLESGVLGANLN